MSLSDKSAMPMPFPTLPEALEHWARVAPGRIALTAGSEELTYSQLSERVGRCRTWLRAQGVSAGDRVVLAGFNTVPWVVHYLAVLGLEAIIAPANNRLNPSQFSDQVTTLEAALVLRDEDHAELSSQVTGVPVHDLDHEEPESATTLTAPSPAAPALISFTSGTTGRPKGAMLTHDALTEASWAFVRVMHTGPEDSTLVVVPIFHNTGFVDQLGHMLLVGGRTDLLRKYKTALAVEALRARPVSYLAAVPSIHRLIMLADGAEEALRPMRILLYGGSPMPANWIREYLTRWPQLRLYHGYGLTEYGSAISFLGSEYAEARGESVGHAVPGTSIRIVDEDGRDVRQGEAGELLVQGPTMMQGYWRQPELTAQKITDGWLRTGDLARVDDEGFYYIEGRVDDVINRGGEKILPSHVEGLLSEDPAVAQSIVFPLPDPILQQRVYAAVERKLDQNFNEDQIMQRLRSGLPDYAVPERVFVSDALPRTASGKIDRRATAQQFSDQVINVR